MLKSSKKSTFSVHDKIFSKDCIKSCDCAKSQRKGVSLCEKCPQSEFLWSVFFTIQNENAEIKDHSWKNLLWFLIKIYLLDTFYCFFVFHKRPGPIKSPVRTSSNLKWFVFKYCKRLKHLISYLESFNKSGL